MASMKEIAGQASDLSLDSEAVDGVQQLIRLNKQVTGVVYNNGRCVGFACKLYACMLSIYGMQMTYVYKVCRYGLHRDKALTKVAQSCTKYVYKICAKTCKTA